MTRILQGAEWELHALHKLYQMLRAAGDPRATPLLARLHARVLAIAGPLDDATRHTFLEHMPINRAIQAAWAAHQTSTEATSAPERGASERRAHQEITDVGRAQNEYGFAVT